MFGLGRKKFVVLDAVEPDHGPIAVLHAGAFPRGWSKSEISQLSGQSGTTLLTAHPVGSHKKQIWGFNLIRQSQDEAEILSIAVDPKLRRAGIADALMREAILRLRADRVGSLFLEVDGTNVAAVNLYIKLGFETVGSRPGYYKKDQADETAERATALVMRLDLV